MHKLGISSKLCPTDGFWPSLASGLLPFGALILLLSVVHLTGHDVLYLLRDPVMTPERSLFDGIVSNIGIVITTMGVAVLGRALVYSDHMPTAARLLLCWMLLFLLDDALLLHEQTGNLQVLVQGGYGIAMLVLHMMMSRTYGRPIIWPIVFVLFWLGISSLLDTIPVYFERFTGISVPQSVYHGVAVIEDVAKFAGICTVFLLAAGVADRLKVLPAKAKRF